MEPLYLAVIFGVIAFQFISMKLGGWLMPFILGIFGLGFGAATLEGTIRDDIPLFPFPTLLLIVVSVILMIFAVTKRGE